MGPGASLCFGRRIKWDSDRTDKINGDVAHPGLDSGPMAGSDFVYFLRGREFQVCCDWKRICESCERESAPRIY